MNLQRIFYLATVLFFSSSLSLFASDGGPLSLPRGDGDLGPPECGDPPCTPQGAPEWSVNMVNMNLFVQDIPLWYDVPVGPDVQAQLSYNSADDISGHELFGNKWSFGYTSYLESDVDGNITITMPDGREDTYPTDGSGSYSQPYKVFNELVQVTATHYELELRSGTVMVYDHDASALGKIFLTGIFDTRGNGLTMTYDVNNLLTTVTDSLGQITTFTYNANNLVSQVEDPFGRLALFGYDTGRNLVQIEDMGGYVTNFEYDTGGMLQAIVNGAGRTEFYTEPADQTTPQQLYPEPGGAMMESYRITVTLPDNRKEEYFYNATAGESWYIAPEDYVEYKNVNWNNYTHAEKTVYGLASTSKGSMEEVASISYPGDEKRLLGIDYDTGLISDISDAAGNTTYYTYNDKGRVVTKTSPKDVLTTYVYESGGTDIQRIETGLGNTEYTRNAYREIEQVTNRLGKTTVYGYNTYGQIETITDPLNIVTTIVYNAAHHIQEIQRDGIVVAEFTYDTIGRVATSTDATGLQLTYGYDDLNHLILVTYPDTKTISYEYNSQASPHLLTRVVDRSGREWSYVYDAFKQLRRAVNPEKGVTEYNFDGNGNLVEFIDPNKNTTTYEYNTNNRPILKTYADSSSVSYDYYNTGQLKKRINARGIQSSYKYDEEYNVISITYTDETPELSLVYDDYNRLTNVEDGLGNHVLGYNNISQLTSIDGPLADDTLVLHYDDSSRRTGFDIQGGDTITYTLDNLNRLTTLAAGSAEYIYTYPDNKNPLIDTLTRPNGSSTSYSYIGPLSWLSGVSNYKANTDLINSYTYTYNAQDLRSSEEITNGLEASGFVTGLREFEYNELNQQLSATNPETTFSYDADGNLTKGFTPDGFQFTARYDAENRLASIEYVDDETSIFHKRVFTYRWDDFLGRIRTYADNRLTGETHIVRGESLVLQDRNANNTVVRQYTWGQNLGGGIGGLLDMVDGDEDYYYLYDGRGNVTTLLDNTQSTIASYSYNSFGRLMQQSGLVTQPFQFSTKRYDAETGLSYYGYRFYSPATERWLNRDPLGEDGGINLYGFVESNPIDFVDPDGLFAVGIGFNGSGGIGLGRTRDGSPNYGAGAIGSYFGSSRKGGSALMSVGSIDIGNIAGGVLSRGVEFGVYGGDVEEMCGKSLGGSVSFGPFNATIYKDSSGNWGATFGVGIGPGTGVSFQETDTFVRPYIESSWGK